MTVLHSQMFYAILSAYHLAAELLYYFEKLREECTAQGGMYEVVGSCLIYGIMDAEAFLGPFPKGIRVRRSLGWPSPAMRFWNSDTKAMSREDP